MATFILSVTITATNAEITKVIQGLEMLRNRINGETDLQFAKRLWVEYLKDAYKRKRQQEIIDTAIAANPIDIDVA